MKPIEDSNNNSVNNCNQAKENHKMVSFLERPPPKAFSFASFISSIAHLICLFTFCIFDVVFVLRCLAVFINDNFYCFFCLDSNNRRMSNARQDAIFR